MTTPTPKRIAVETIQTQHGPRDVITDVQAVGAYVEQLERERDEALARNVKALEMVLDLTADRDAWKAKKERACVWTLTRQSNITGRCDSECGSKNAMVWLYNPKFGYVFCPFCGGRIVKEDK